MASPSKPLYEQPSPAEETAAAKAPDESSRTQFEGWLKHLADTKEPQEGVVAGRVLLLDTDALQERMGDRWPRFADRVHHVIRMELKAHLGPSDLFTRNQNGSYVIVFNNCSEVEARLKAAMISEQILETLLGEDEAKDLETLGIQRLVAKADGSVAAEALESTDTLVAMLDEAEERTGGSSTFTAAEAAAGSRALTPEEVSYLLGEIEHEFDQLELNGDNPEGLAATVGRYGKLLDQLHEIEDSMLIKAPAFGVGLEPVADDQANRSSGPVNPVLARVGLAIQHAERQIDRFRVSDATVSDPSTGGAAPKVEFVCRPMWHAQSNKIGVYLTEAVVVSGDGTPLNINGMDSNQEASVLAVVDRLALRKVRRDLAEVAAKGISSITMVPIHLSTLLRHRSREDYLKLCSHLPDNARNALCWEIVDADARTWTPQMKAAIGPLKPFGRAVFLRIADPQANMPVVRRNLHCLRAAEVQAIGVDVSTLRGTEAEVFRLLEEIAELAETNGMTCYGRGFRSLSMTISAVCMGYQLIAGQAIADPVPHPECLHTTAMEDIYGRDLFAATTGHNLNAFALSAAGPKRGREPRYSAAS
ncbi:hypothetical protein [Pelagibius sp.]|uniref:hypothetical protein n=1 Tax=Pelagibius sp. TaxID=1931238 RepID=UPI002631BC9B|nr:hypothetical protein [Pelagibius sp.]